MSDIGIGSVSDEMYLSVSSDDYAWKNRMRKLAEENPNEVIVKKLPEEPSDYMTIWVPKKWVKIRPKRKMSDEQKEKQIETLKRASQKPSDNSDEFDSDLPFCDTDDYLSIEDDEEDFSF